MKTFKKFLHAANNHGIQTKLNYKDVRLKRMTGQYTFLTPEELKTLFEYYNTKYINTSWKNILQRYLFSCFTGLRLGDIETIKEENFIDGNLVFTASKVEKFTRIKLNKTAISLVNLPRVFNGHYSRGLF
ncbi:MAG: hypothetical protein JKY53_14825 [Flavobacteriales bacterium]|nr:hypothetical protein [Flavobacteriales bacterium]